MSWLTPRRIGALAVAWLLALGGAQAQEKDDSLLDEVAKRRAIAAQALEREARDALAEANKLASDPAKAIELLKRTLQKVEADDALSIVQKASLQGSLRNKLKVLEDPAARAGAEAAQKRSDELQRHLEKLNGEQAAREALRRDLELIKSLRERGQDAQAQKLAEELGKKHPNDPAVLLARDTVASAARVKEASQVLASKASGFTSSGVDMLRSATALPDDITYPPNWRELSKKRQEAYLKNLAPMSDKEKEIVRSLNEVVATEVEFQGTSFEKVIEELQKMIGQPIIVNKEALKDLDLSYERPVTVRLPREITKRTILRSVLAEVGLTYVIRGETIHVTDPERARGMLVTRFFVIDDLLANGLGGLFGGDKASADQLVDLIQRTVDPLSWEKNGGPGSIIIQGPIMIVRNTAEVINMLGGGSRSRAGR